MLDKGIVIDAWMRVSLGGIGLMTVEAHFIVASIDTYSAYRSARNEGGGVMPSSIFEQMTARNRA